tara:strand:+ start:13813 stop:14214 length:402 start_codon:yes stop_codon:yes gene_type:complete
MKIIKTNKHKHKFNRRRALECKLVEKSKNNPGYLKYMVTIGEKDGTKHTQPVYGKDMQDALSRLINKERTLKVEKKITGNPFLFFLGWMAVMGWPVLISDVSNTPWFIVYGFVGVIGLILVASWWWSYIHKGE